MPTRKWWAASVVAAGTVAIMALTGNGIDTDEETIAWVGIVVQRLVAYITPNA